MRELKSAITATAGARASSMTSQRQAYSVSFELLFFRQSSPEPISRSQRPSQTAGVAVQHVSFIL